MSFPSKNVDFPELCNKLPEGKCLEMMAHELQTLEYAALLRMDPTRTARMIEEISELVGGLERV